MIYIEVRGKIGDFCWRLGDLLSVRSAIEMPSFATYLSHSREEFGNAPSGQNLPTQACRVAGTLELMREGLNYAFDRG